jgi:hypothetical protein
MDLSFRDLPVATFEELKTALTALFNAHPLLAGLLSHPDGLQEQVDLWPIMEALSDSSVLLLRLSDLGDEVEDVLGTLVNYNNNSWNFDPNYTPAKVNYRLACMLVRCLLNQDGLLQVELDVHNSAGYPQLLVMYQGRKKVFLELWSWSDPEYYRHEEVSVSSHLTLGPATKRFEKVVKSWEPIQEEEE